jgi:periplasmic divalent cation tolerance protein
MGRLQYKVVLVTAPDFKVARRLARAALKARLVACANLVPQVESHYVWQGKPRRSSEVLLVMKTTAARVAALERAIAGQHPYDTPEFVVLKVASGAKKYLAWLAQSCAGGRANRGT